MLATQFMHVAVPDGAAVYFLLFASFREDIKKRNAGDF